MAKHSVVMGSKYPEYSSIITISPITKRAILLIPPHWADRAYSGDGCDVSRVEFNPRQKWDVQFFKREYDGREVWIVRRTGIMLHMDKEEFRYTFGEVKILEAKDSENR